VAGNRPDDPVELVVAVGRLLPCHRGSDTIAQEEDRDLEVLAPSLRRATCAGTRAAELALRLKYAGVALDRLRVLPSLPDALDDALAAAPAGRLFALPTYTALLELRDELSDRGHVAQFWEHEPAARG